MELSFSYFWLIKGSIAVITLWFLYKAYDHLSTTGSLKSVWAALAIAATILQVFIPIRMDVATKATTDRANALIEQGKFLPTMIKDDSFEESNKLESISNEDIWSKP